MSRTGKSREKVHQWLLRAGEVGEVGVGDNNKNALWLALVTAAQIHGYTKHHWTAQFTWADHTANDLYVSKADTDV